jgi:hypothetical protein
MALQQCTGTLLVCFNTQMRLFAKIIYTQLYIVQTHKNIQFYGLYIQTGNGNRYHSMIPTANSRICKPFSFHLKFGNPTQFNSRNYFCASKQNLSDFSRTILEPGISNFYECSMKCAYTAVS